VKKARHHTKGKAQHHGSEQIELEKFKG